MIMIVGTLLLNDDFFRVFFIFLNFSFLGLLGRGVEGGIKGQKMAQYDKNIWSGAIHISETMHHMIVIYGTLM